MVTLKEVAAAAGVSTVTASSVLSGVNRVRVASHTAIRIREVARSMNYVPLAAARGLRTGRTHVVAYLTASSPATVWDYSWEESLRGVSDVLWEREERLLLGLPKNGENEIELLRQLAFGRQVDGIILQGEFQDDPRPDLLRQAERPFVIIGGNPPPGVHAVVFDLSAFGKTLADLSNGICGSVVFIMPNEQDKGELKTCMAGYHEAGGVKEAIWTGAFLPSPDWLVEQRARAGDKPLGIILMRTLLPELMGSLAAAKLELDKDVQVAYISSNGYMLMPVPGLRQLYLDHYTLGRKAAQILFDLIDEKENPPAAERIYITPWR